MIMDVFLLSLLIVLIVLCTYKSKRKSKIPFDVELLNLLKKIK